MAAPKLRAANVPTPGPWLVRGEPDDGVPVADATLGVEPATEEQPGGWPYLIRQDRAFALGDCPLHLATGIQRLADAKLMAAAPDLAAALLSLLISPGLTAYILDPDTRAALTPAWSLLVRVAPHFEIWAEDQPSTPGAQGH